MSGFSNFLQRNGIGVGLYIILAVTLWLIVLIILPQLTMLDLSFRYNPYALKDGQTVDQYTLENYRYFLFGHEGNSDAYNKIDVLVLLRTIAVAVFVAVFDLIICYPIAYALAQAGTSGKARLMFLALIVPYWVNELLRAFAFLIIFSHSGVINQLGIDWGLWATPIDFKNLDVALYAGLGYAYILLMIFPIYTAIESLDRNQIEAARDMGAPWWRVHWRVVIPFAKPGIASGCTMVFMLTAGALAAPQILGSTSTQWFTQTIVQWFNNQNWPRGSAYSIILLTVTIMVVLLAMRIFKVRITEIGK